jgi:hypothetical protein
MARIRSTPDQVLIDKRLRKEQAGFRPGRSCLHHIFTLRSIIEECLEFRSNLIVNIVDFEKVFDTIHRSIGTLTNFKNISISNKVYKHYEIILHKLELLC